MSEKVTLFMESTKKDPEQTIAEIQLLLKKFGVRDVLINYNEQGEAEALSFTIQHGDVKIPFRLPVNHRPIWELAKRGKTKYIKDELQARRVAWRQIYRWIQAQIALIETQMVTVEEVFLPYMLLKDNKTVYKAFLESGFKGYLPGGDTKRELQEKEED